MRLGAVVHAALFALAATAVAARDVCVAGDGAWTAKVCYSDVAGPVGYDHPILGDTPEWTELVYSPGPAGLVAGQTPWTWRFESGFFEDIAPRLADLDGDGRAEIIAVHTDPTKGARLVVISTEQKLRAATAYIGQRHRWLAPAGVGDFDGDGRVEIAYVDRPHLARELVFVRLEGKTLREVARLPGYSNHRIGDAKITGGTRNCGQGDELVLPDAGWSRVVAVRLGAEPVDLGAFSPAAVKAALACR